MTWSQTSWDLLAIKAPWTSEESAFRLEKALTLAVVTDVFHHVRNDQQFKSAIGPPAQPAGCSSGSSSGGDSSSVESDFCATADGILGAQLARSSVGEDGLASEEFVLENEIVVARLVEHLSTSFRRLGIIQARVVARGAYTRGALRVSYSAQQTLAPRADSGRDGSC